MIISSTFSRQIDTSPNDRFSYWEKIDSAEFYKLPGMILRKNSDGSFSLKTSLYLFQRATVTLLATLKNLTDHIELNIPLCDQLIPLDPLKTYQLQIQMVTRFEDGLTTSNENWTIDIKPSK